MIDDTVITVLVVDDDALVRRSLSDIFSGAADITVVDAVTDGDEVLPAVERHGPRVVLMDLKMKRMGGLVATRALMTLPHPPKVVAMTSMDVDDLVVRSIEAGAHSFLSKSEAPETFHQSVRAVASGNTLFSQESLRQIVAHNQASPPLIDLRILTDREREVLGVMATGATNSTIATKLHMSQTTVKTHLQAAFHKLQVANRVEAALVAFRAGLVE
ncbi:MAG: response regulator transcription factor [Rhodococcus sp. (in: high G+C Gram-positive bacteria)]